jgi:hypothetical protein
MQRGDDSGAETEAATPLPLVLSTATALTALQFHSCIATVQGLAGLTRLQRPTLVLRNAATPTVSTQLQEALPQLQVLTYLCLGGVVAEDDVLQHVSSLPRLQELTLEGGKFTLASLQQLPQSLTHLSIDWGGSNLDAVSRKLSVSTVPSLCALTGLQQLEVRSGAVGLDLLARLTSLKAVDVGHAALEGPCTLSVLTALMQLTRLVLPSLDAAVVPSNADMAAVTAPPQLACLDISKTDLAAGACQQAFVAGRQLSQLTELCASFDLISSGREACLAAASCPNLASISLHEQRGGFAFHAVAHNVDLASVLAGLQPLQHLTSLPLNAGQAKAGSDAWCALTRLTQLHKLNVYFRDELSGLGWLTDTLQLSSLQQLTSLQVESSFYYPSTGRGARGGPGSGGRFSIKLEGEQVRATSSCIGCQMPPGFWLGFGRLILCKCWTWRINMM